MASTVIHCGFPVPNPPMVAVKGKFIFDPRVLLNWAMTLPVPEILSVVSFPNIAIYQSFVPEISNHVKLSRSYFSCTG